MAVDGSGDMRPENVLPRLLTEDQKAGVDAAPHAITALNPVASIADVGAEYQGVINAPADFPTPAAVLVGWSYSIGTDVTDNDPTKTNTGLSFEAGQDILWNGTTWVTTDSFSDADAVVVDLIRALTQGQLVQGAAAGGPEALAPGAAGRMLQANGVGALTWIAKVFSDYVATATGGAHGDIFYVDAAGDLQILLAGAAGQMLQTNGAAIPTWVAKLFSDYVATATGGAHGDIFYVDAAGDLQILLAGAAGQMLQTNGAAIPTWVAKLFSDYIGTASGGAHGDLLSIDGTGLAQLLPAGVAGRVLQSNGAADPTWVNSSGQGWTKCADHAALLAAMASATDEYILITADITAAADYVPNGRKFIETMPGVTLNMAAFQIDMASGANPTDGSIFRITVRSDDNPAVIFTGASAACTYNLILGSPAGAWQSPLAAIADAHDASVWNLVIGAVAGQAAILISGDDSLVTIRQAGAINALTTVGPFVQLQSATAGNSLRAIIPGITGTACAGPGVFLNRVSASIGDISWQAAITGGDVYALRLEDDVYGNISDLLHADNTGGAAGDDAQAIRITGDECSVTLGRLSVGAAMVAPANRTLIYVSGNFNNLRDGYSAVSDGNPVEVLNVAGTDNKIAGTHLHNLAAGTVTSVVTGAFTSLRNVCFGAGAASTLTIASASAILYGCRTDANCDIDLTGAGASSDQCHLLADLNLGAANQTATGNQAVDLTTGAFAGLNIQGNTLTGNLNVNVGASGRIGGNIVAGAFDPGVLVTETGVVEVADFAALEAAINDAGVLEVLVIADITLTGNLTVNGEGKRFSTAPGVTLDVATFVANFNGATAPNNAVVDVTVISDSSGVEIFAQAAIGCRFNVVMGDDTDPCQRPVWDTGDNWAGIDAVVHIHDVDGGAEIPLLADNGKLLVVQDAAITTLTTTNPFIYVGSNSGGPDAFIFELPALIGSGVVGQGVRLNAFTHATIGDITWSTSIAGVEAYALYVDDAVRATVAGQLDINNINAAGASDSTALRVAGSGNRILVNELIAVANGGTAQWISVGAERNHIAGASCAVGGAPAFQALTLAAAAHTIIENCSFRQTGTGALTATLPAGSDDCTFDRLTWDAGAASVITFAGLRTIVKQNRMLDNNVDVALTGANSAISHAISLGDITLDANECSADCNDCVDLDVQNARVGVRMNNNNVTNLNGDAGSSGICDGNTYSGAIAVANAAMIPATVTNINV